MRESSSTTEANELRIGAFSFQYGDVKLQGPDLTLHRGEIAQVFGSSDSRSDEICLYIAGLLTRLHRTDPAPDGHYRRTERKVNASDLAELSLNGRSLHQMSDIERAKNVGIIFGDPSRYIMGDIVREEVRFAFAAIEKSPFDFDQHRLHRYGLQQVATRATEVLSGGERHRLNIACVLELEPSLLVADFSRCNLDADFLSSVNEWLISQCHERVTVVYGLPPGTFPSDKARPLLVHGGLLSEGDPDPTIFPNLHDEGKLLVTKLNPTPVGEAVLEVKGLHRRGITTPTDFILHRGEILLVHGRNGIGKTTLGNILAGRIKGRRVGGGTEPRLNAHKPLMSLQDAERFFPWGSKISDLIESNVQDACGLSRTYSRMDPRILPFSKQKLLSAAIVLRYSKGFAILDEPTAGMDFEDKLRLMELLDSRGEMAVIIFTHDVAIANIGRIHNF